MIDGFNVLTNDVMASFYNRMDTRLAVNVLGVNVIACYMDFHGQRPILTIAKSSNDQGVTKINAIRMYIRHIEDMVGRARALGLKVQAMKRKEPWITEQFIDLYCQKKRSTLLDEDC